MSTICSCPATSEQRGPGSGASNLAWDPPNLQPWFLGPPDLCPSVETLFQGVLSRRFLSIHTTSSLSWVPHIRKLISRGNRLFAQCVSWCRSEHLSLAFASNLFHTDVLPSVSWGAEFCSGSTPAARLLDGAIRRWSRCLLGAPRGSPVAVDHLESGWPDAQRLITCRLLSLFGRITSMPIRDCSPFPASVSCVMASFPGSLVASCSDLCAALEIVAPSSFGVGPSCSLHRVREWSTQCAVPPLVRALRDRLLTAAAVLTVHHVDPTTITANQHADPVVHSWPSSPSNARFWGLSRGDTTHSLVVGVVVIWDVTRHVLCAVQPQETCLTALQCALFSQICGRSGATSVPSPLTEPLLGSSTRGPSSLGLM